MKMEELKKLARAIRSEKSEHTLNFSVDGEVKEVVLTKEAMNKTLREELYAKIFDDTATGFERNKFDLFDLIQTSTDVKMPKDIANYFEGFAQITQYNRDDAPEVTINKANKYYRERATITQVGNAGVYEVFKMPKEGKVKLNMITIGGAAQISFEDFMTGRVDWDELINIIELGLADRVYDEILKGFEMIERKLPAANKGESTDFDPKVLEKELDVVSAYGSPVIFCTIAFARTITEGTDWASEKEKTLRREIGYMTDYKNAKVVVIPQTYTDETNSTKKVRDDIAYIMPDTGSKPIQVALQGPLNVKDVDNSDWSKEIHVYKRVGVGVFSPNELCTYTITSLA